MIISNIYSNDKKDKYYRCIIDNTIPAEFTENQIDVAITRAKKHPEHFQNEEQEEYKWGFCSFFSKLFF